MRLRTKLATLLAGSALAATALVGIVGTAPSGAVNFTCGTNHVCFFQNTNYTGNDTDISPLTFLGDTGMWTFIPQGTRGSLNDNNNENMQVYAANTGTHQSVFGNTKVVLNGTFGWWCAGTWADCDTNLPS